MLGAYRVGDVHPAARALPLWLWLRMRMYPWTWRDLRLELVILTERLNARQAARAGRDFDAVAGYAMAETLQRERRPAIAAWLARKRGSPDAHA